MRLMRRRILEVEDAGGDVGLPRQPHQRREVGPAVEVWKAPVKPADHVVAEVHRHDRLDERNPVLGRVREDTGGDVLAAADAVQVRVLQPHGSHAELAQLGEAAAEIRPGPHLLTHVVSLLSTPNAALAMSTIAPPPSTGRTAPFTYELAGDASHAIASAASSGVPGRRSGTIRFASSYAASRSPPVRSASSSI